MLIFENSIFLKIFGIFMVFKIIFLFDEKIFFGQYFFYDLEYVPRVLKSGLERSRSCTGCPRSRNSKKCFFCIRCSLGTLMAPQLRGSFAATEARRPETLWKPMVITRDHTHRVLRPLGHGNDSTGTVRGCKAS